MTERKYEVISSPPPTGPRYYILSLIDEADGLLLWYRPESLGYTTRLEDAGTFDEAYVKRARLNEHRTAAVPVETAQSLARRVVSSDHKRLLAKLAGARDPEFGDLSRR